MSPVLVTLAALLAAAPASQNPAVPIPPPRDAECLALPAVKPPLVFPTGEILEYDLDALGAQAGKLTMRVLPPKAGALLVQAEAKNNTFFAKIRRVNGGGISHLNPKTLRPFRYVEDTMEDGIHRTANVTFRPKDHHVIIDYTENEKATHLEYKYANEGLDLVGAMYLLRQIPLQVGMPVCFDAYGVRRLWRVFGKVEAKEHVSLPIGEFDAYRLSGMAVRLDNYYMRREIHLWISTDARRLPLVAMGVIDLGAVRATLSAFTRPDARARAEGKESLKW